MKNILPALAALGFAFVPGISTQAVAKDYTDPLSGMKYTIPDEVPVKVQETNADGRPLYLLASRHASPPMTVVYASYLRAQDDKGTVRETIEREGGLQTNRPNRIITKRTWKMLAGKEYHIIESYDKGEPSNTYFVTYMYAQDKYIYCFNFTTGTPQDELVQVRESVVAHVRYPQ